MKFVRKIFNILLLKLLPRGQYKNYQNYIYNTNTKNYSKIGEHVHLLPPLYLSPQNIELESFTRLQTGVHIITASTQKVVIKKYSVISAETMIVNNTHIPTVGIPQYLSYIGINDVDGRLVIPEDVWVGVRCIILPKAKIGRGCVFGAGTLVNKTYPPYSVVAGVPGKIIGVRFSLEQILKHEASLYPQKERFSKEYLEELFKEKYSNLKVIGLTEIGSIYEDKLLNCKLALGMADYSNASNL